MPIPSPILQGIGIGQAIDTSGIAQAFQHQSQLQLRRQELEQQRTERNKEQANMRQRQAINDLDQQLSDKEFLSGSPNDEVIKTGLLDIKNQGAQAALNGASSAEIAMMMAPKIKQLSQYSIKSRQVNDRINEAAQYYNKGKYGYDVDKMMEQARHDAFFDQDPKTGKWTLKSPDKINTDQDYMANVLQRNPEQFTSSAALDEFVKGVPMKDVSDAVTTSNKGVSNTTSYEAKLPFYMQVAKDAQGNPTGLQVQGSELTGDNNQPLINPTTKQPYKAVPESVYDAVTLHNPGVTNFIRGRTREAFKSAGVEPPDENTPQFQAMARSVLHDELAQRDRSFYKNKAVEKESALAQKVALGGDPVALAALQTAQAALRKPDAAGAGTTPKLTAGDRRAFDKYKEDAQTKYYAYASKLDGIDNLEKDGSTDGLKGSINKYGTVKKASKDWFGEGYTVKYEDNKGATQKKEFKNKEDMVKWLQEGDDQVVDPDNIDINEWMQTRSGAAAKAPASTKPTAKPKIKPGELN